MNPNRSRFALLFLCLLASCQAGGDQPTTVTGRPALSPARRVVARIREDVDGQPKGAPGVDLVALDQNTTTTLSVGDELRVELKASTGTGYQWVFVGCSTDLSATDSPLTPHFDWKKGEGRMELTEPGKPGAPGMWVFVLDAARTGEVTMRFALGRPWEKGSKPAQERTLKVRVR